MVHSVYSCFASSHFVESISILQDSAKQEVSHTRCCDKIRPMHIVVYAPPCSKRGMPEWVELQIVTPSCPNPSDFRKFNVLKNIHWQYLQSSVTGVGLDRTRMKSTVSQIFHLFCSRCNSSITILSTAVYWIF